MAPDGSFYPKLALELPTHENGGISPDGLTITWKLRDHIVWSDGQPFTSDDVLFTWHNSHISCEYMYLSDGAPTTDRYLTRAEHFYPDDQLYLARHYLGLSLGGEIIPILQLMAMGLLNAQDLSGLAIITLVYNIADEADFVAGIMAPWGKRPTTDTVIPTLNSEYGQSPFNLFLETRFYF